MFQTDAENNERNKLNAVGFKETKRVTIEVKLSMTLDFFEYSSRQSVAASKQWRRGQIAYRHVHVGGAWTTVATLAEADLWYYM